MSGDADAFVREHASLVCGVVLGIVSDVRASEEIAQDVFLHAWRGLHRLRNPAGLRAWLRQIARNHAHEHLRRRYRERRVFTDAEVEQAIDPTAGADEALLAREREQAVSEALDALPADSREVLALYYREGHSVRQVAELLELQEATVRKRMSRARDLLREDVLARLGEDLERTAPGAAFVAGVAAAIALLPAPAAAAAPRWRYAGVAVAGFLAVGGAALVVQPDASPPLVAVTTPPPPPPPVAVAPPVVVPQPPEDLAAESPAVEAIFALAEAGGHGVVRCDVSGVDGWEQIGGPRQEVRDGVLTMIVERPEGISNVLALDGENVAIVSWEGAHAGEVGSCQVTAAPPGDPPLSIDATLDALLAESFERSAARLEAEQAWEDIGVSPIDAALAQPGLSPEARAHLEAWRPTHGAEDLRALADELRDGADQ